MSDYVEDSAAGRPVGAPLAQRAGAAFGSTFGRPASRPAATAQERTGRHFIRWERLGLAAILTLSAALNLYGLANQGYANTYYARTRAAPSFWWRLRPRPTPASSCWRPINL